MNMTYLRKSHKQSIQNPLPDPLARPKLHKRNSKPNTRKEQRLHKIFLRIQEIPLKGMREFRTFALLPLTFFPAHYDEWALGVFTGEIGEEGSREEGAEEHGCSCVCGDADES